jgi:HSP20 family protein
MATRTQDRPNRTLAPWSGGRYLPLSQVIDRLFEESFLMPSFFGGDGLGRIAGPTGTNLWETSESYVAQLAMPGVNPSSIACEVKDNVLTCRAEPAIEAPADARAIWEGLGGTIDYQIALPGEVDPGAAEASYDHGVLTVVVPKAAHARAHPIKVVAR